MKIFSKINTYFKNLYLVQLIKKHCLASKVIILLGLISFFFTAISIFYIDYLKNPSLLTIQSIMSSIFGYLFGDNVLKKDKSNSKNLYTIIASIISFFSLIVLMISSLVNIDQESTSIIEIRNLLFLSVGFLISKSKSHDISEEINLICSEKEKKD
ncbi:hypothetical protein [Clostridium sp.]|uniref:hypothetical protein n=1 Tax=Clostridium sp. TaxID=1506 RepID=UPI00261B7224|nr:hypothetical protein [Clostridium sp.]